jgi:hypothetical protein
MERRAMQQVDNKKFKLSAYLSISHMIWETRTLFFPLWRARTLSYYGYVICACAKTMFIPGRGAFPKPDEEELTTGKSDTIFSLLTSMSLYWF